MTDLHMFILCNSRTTNRNPAAVSCQLCLEYVQEVSRLYVTIVEDPCLHFILLEKSVSFNQFCLTHLSRFSL
jgi:hypothetical protein